MIKYDKSMLENSGYEIINCRIKNASLSMKDHGSFTFLLMLDGDGVGIGYGGYCIGKGYLEAPDNYFRGSAEGIESIMRIMDVVGVEEFSELENKYVRIATKGLSSPVKIIGNIIKNKWFDIESFYQEKRK